MVHLRLPVRLQEKRFIRIFDKPQVFLFFIWEIIRTFVSQTRKIARNENSDIG